MDTSNEEYELFYKLMEAGKAMGEICDQILLARHKPSENKRKMPKTAPEKASNVEEDAQQKVSKGRYSTAEFEALTHAAKDLGFDDYHQVPKDKYDEFMEHEEIQALNRNSKSILMQLKKKDEPKEKKDEPKEKKDSQPSQLSQKDTEPAKKAVEFAESQPIPSETPKAKKHRDRDTPKSKNKKRKHSKHSTNATPSM
ncbi:hypothetical protein J8273_6044 [Carpediemonas membranifera]|uniref:Uncharacterized protein n=1 Tax=Carpediemonas membranifera TaxID=201153 RepID=A0A8J6E129_9EUKA|nr:hypothetical protein J8273_6044 [Carpediemonas membranifera]|eukprot:KAG9392576.1 hypothetical protein J8273_6044 [Carpediemonas membranifera]